MMEAPRFDYIIVGSGIAGLYTALLAQEHGSVLLVTKGSLEEANTRYAQGGIAAAIGPDDSPQLHYEDTIRASAGLCNEEAVRILAEEAADRISDLIALGVPFDTINGEIALTREAAHTVPRVLHAGGDATGFHIETTLSQRLRQSAVRVLEHTLVTAILVGDGGVEGIATIDVRTQAQASFRCRYLVLASGGCGRLYRFSTNSLVATGDGVALAYNAGAEIVDMEFIQFHPTALRLPGAPSFLITEAVRGEGGILRNIHGHRFMPDYDPRAELAPRDVVARAIVSEMQRTGADHVLLDVTHLPAARVRARFPQITQFCLARGLDITRTPIPVAPAAHYMIGGVRTTVWGETNLPGLYACGEVACVGVHGANRLASNSLLETLVFGKRLVQRTLDPQPSVSTAWPNDLSLSLPPAAPRETPEPASLGALQRLLWDHAGIIRSGPGLETARAILSAWAATLPTPVDRAGFELRNHIAVARLIVEAAYRREESRGAHYRTDFPEPSPAWERHIVFSRTAG